MGDCKTNPITISAVATAGVNRSGKATRDLVSSSSFPKPWLFRLVSVEALSLAMFKVLSEFVLALLKRAEPAE
jgi:hypothetical protein